MNKIDVEKNFLENLDYLEQLVKLINDLDYLKQLVKLINAKPISDFDKNLTYEVIYADAYVESIIPQVEDTKLVATLSDIKTVLDLVVSEISIDEVNRQRKSKDYKKLLKAKYTDKIEGSFDEDVPYEPVSSPLKYYFKNRLLLIITLALLSLFLMCGGTSAIASLLPKSAEVKAVSTLICLLSSSFIILLSSLFITLFVLVGTLEISLDLIYMAMPAIRDILDRNGHNRLYSIYAKSAIEEYNNQLVHFKKVKSYDRIKRNFFWLDSMISRMEVMDLGIEQAVLYKRLIELKSNFDGSIKHNTSEYYRQVAKIEFLHNEYLKLVEE